ncbi:hypothetical protein MKZ38_005908 [Zalerion maritima]|uniref:Heterokaryon incompatibility domain-containing protein n=1 Tax=Zalerion maritima TaxID=339359 RepID=A0AAD5WNR4_9PEZI|nr:hypothetical protein MKZ38_005908 [Zalerion maritima]
MASEDMLGSQPMSAYRPLEPREIRILHLHPGAGNDPVTVHLFHERLDGPDHHQFEALSYVWGTSDPASLVPIRVGHGTLFVTLNLHLALRHLRYSEPGRIRLLWADALCINQSDVAERNRQVKMMGDIYSRASRTTVWLGEETPEGTGGIQAFRDAAAFLPPKLMLTADEAKSELAASFDSMARNREQLVNAANWAAALAMLSAPWFQRRWTIQEVVLAKVVTFVYGEDSLDWDDMSRIVTALGQNGLSRFFGYLRAPNENRLSFMSGLNNAGMLLSIRNLHRKDTGGARLSWLLATLDKFSCTDPRDQLFALYGMANDVDSMPESLMPDYSEDATFEPLIKAYVSWQLNQGKRLEFLCFVPRQPSASTGCTTWCPDFNRPDYNPTNIHVFYQRFNACGNVEASGDMRKLWNRGTDEAPSDAIVLAGRIVGRVTAIADEPFTLPTLEGNCDPLEKSLANWGSVLDDIDTCERMARGGLVEVPDAGAPDEEPLRVVDEDDRPRQSVLQRVVRTLCWSLGRGGNRDLFPALLQDIQDLLPLLREYVTCGAQVPPSFDRSLFSILTSRVDEPLSLGMTRRKLGLADTACMLLLPGPAEMNDVVVVLGGCRLPCVLRPWDLDNDRGQAHYRFVGLCYAEGFMDGEGFDDEGAGKNLAGEEYCIV